MIEIKNIFKQYSKRTILNDVNISFKESGIYAILGPNGSGKTTLIKIILGMVIPTKGQVIFNGNTINGEWKYRKNIAYLSQNTNFPNNLLVQELIYLVKDIRGNTTNEEALISLFNLQPYLNKKFYTLSDGTKQKVNILLSFMHQNDIFLLDEPTTGLDPIAYLHLKNILLKKKEEQKIIIITSHVVSFIESVADKIICLLGGNIFYQGTANHLKEKTNKPDLDSAIPSILGHERF